MGYKTALALLGGGLLAACEPLPEGTSGNGLDSYFAVNVGRHAGRAEALASLCPSLQFNTATLQQKRSAICEGNGQNRACALPTLDAEMQHSKAATLASLHALSSEQACAYAHSEAVSDLTLAEYFIGLPVARVAQPVVAAPVPEPEPEEPVEPEEPEETPVPEGT